MVNDGPFSHSPSEGTCFSLPSDLLEIRQAERVDQWELYALKRFSSFFSPRPPPSQIFEPPSASSSSFSVPSIFNSFILPFVKEVQSASMEEKKEENGSESASLPICTVNVFHSSQMMNQQCIVLPPPKNASASDRRASAASSPLVTVTQEPLPLSLPSSGISVKRSGYCGVCLTWNCDGTTTVSHDAPFTALPPRPSPSNAMMGSATRISELEKKFSAAAVKGNALFPSTTTALLSDAAKEVSRNQAGTIVREVKNDETKRSTITPAPRPTVEEEKKEDFKFPLLVDSNDPLHSQYMNSLFAPSLKHENSLSSDWDEEENCRVIDVVNDEDAFSCAVARER